MRVLRDFTLHAASRRYLVFIYITRRTAIFAGVPTVKYNSLNVLVSKSLEGSRCIRPRFCN